MDMELCWTPAWRIQEMFVAKELSPVEFIEIVSEKDHETYGTLVHKHKIVKTHAWMIGNSPRSDINPAMKIGLNAVYIPHQHTWQLEHEPVVAGSGKLVILPAFRELRSHF